MSANSNIVSSISSQKPSESRKVDISTRAFWFLFPLKFTNEYTFSYYYVPRTTSTNDLAFTLPLPKETGIQIISAEEQTAGRGQGNSSWESESGKILPSASYAVPNLWNRPSNSACCKPLHWLCDTFWQKFATMLRLNGPTTFT